jgi:acyl-CoA hydrolase
MPLDGLSPDASAVETTHLVLPPDTNMHGTAFGGRIMQWMDIAAAVAAGRHCGFAVVTAAVDDLQFTHSIRMGDVVLVRATVNFTGNTSLEVGVRVESESMATREMTHCLSGYFTMVGVSQDGSPKTVPKLLPHTPEQHQRAAAARRRRERRLQSRAISGTVAVDPIEKIEP